MEITILQLYKVALSAGKAHRDHKHHHVHQFNHDGLISTTTTPAPPPAMVNECISVRRSNLVSYLVRDNCLLLCSYRHQQLLLETPFWLMDK